MFLFTKHGGFNLKSPKIIAPLTISLLAQPVFLSIYETFSAIWCHLYKIKKVKSTHGGVILLQLQTESRNFTKSNTRPWIFFTFLKLYKWYQIAQSITNVLSGTYDVLMLNSNIWGFRDYKDFI